MIFQAPEVFFKSASLLQLSNLSFLDYPHIETCTRINLHLNQHLLLHLYNGEKLIETNNGNYEIREKESIFISKNQYITYKIIDSDNNESNYSSFNGAMIYFDDIFLVSFFKKYPDVLKHSSHLIMQNEVCVPQKSEALDETIKSFQSYIKTGVENETLLMLKFEEVLLHFLDNDSSAQLSNYLNHLYSQGVFSFKDLFETCAFSTVEEMIKVSKLSEDKFRKFFAQVYNKTPKEWLRERSLSKAKRLLKEGGLNVSQVSIACGFNSLSWFVQAFKIEYSVTPKQFQKNHNKNI